MTDIDLTFVKQTVEDLMTDTCRITRNVRGTGDSTLDQATGRVVAHTGQPVTIYEGRCKIKPVFTPVPADEGGAQVVVYRYELAIPLPADPAGEPLNGDHVEMLTALRDPGLVGKRLHVGEGVEYKTFAVQRKLHCEMRQPIGDRP